MNDLLLKRSICEMCGVRQATELHHCIIHRRKGNPKLDAEENLMPVCHQCHMEAKVNSREVRKKFWKEQIKRGYDMHAWYNSLGLKYKEYFDD